MCVGRNGQLWQGSGEGQWVKPNLEVRRDLRDSLALSHPPLSRV